MIFKNKTSRVNLFLVALFIFFGLTTAGLIFLFIDAVLDFDFFPFWQLILVIIPLLYLEYKLFVTLVFRLSLMPGSKESIEEKIHKETREFFSLLLVDFFVVSVIVTGVMFLYYHIDVIRPGFHDMSPLVVKRFISIGLLYAGSFVGGFGVLASLFKAVRPQIVRYIKILDFQKNNFWSSVVVQSYIVALIIIIFGKIKPLIQNVAVLESSAVLNLDIWFIRFNFTETFFVWVVLSVILFILLFMLKGIKRNWWMIFLVVLVLGGATTINLREDFYDYSMRERAIRFLGGADDQNFYDERKNLIEKSFELATEDTEIAYAFYQKAVLLLDQKKYEEALSAALTSRDYEDTNGWVHQVLASIYIRMGDLELAEGSVERCKENPMYYPGACFMSEAEIHNARREYDQAIEAVRTAMAIDPVRSSDYERTLFWYQERKPSFYYTTTEFKQANDVYVNECVNNTQPNHPSCIKQRIRLLWGGGSFTRAEEAFNDAFSFQSYQKIPGLEEMYADFLRDYELYNNVRNRD